jgi:CRP-like cAMP-binding protein
MDPQQFMQIVPYDASPLVNGVELPKKQRPARMLSRARLRAIEASLDHDTPWVPLDPHAKTPGEEAHIERAMQGNFLFQSLTEDQRHTLCGCMKRMDVCAGDIIIKQGSEGDLFYIVESGEFEVLVSQDGAKGDKDLGAVVHRYDATMSPCFGELALMYTKPGQATVRAVTDGSLWTLERDAFRGVLLMRFSNRPSLKFLHSLEILSKLSLSQLHCLADAVTKVPFTDGETIVEKVII